MEEQLADVPHNFVRDLIVGGENCDELSGSTGEFGRSPTSPIPVNGSVGEFKYLARLRTQRGKATLMFHRLGSLEVRGVEGNVDAFEVVSSDGQQWDLLFLHLYHPRRSRKVPKGYVAAPFHPVFSRLPLGLGTTSLCRDFPSGLPTVVEEHLGELGPGADAVRRTLSRILNGTVDFRRPTQHLARLGELKSWGLTTFVQVDPRAGEVSATDLASPAPVIVTTVLRNHDYPPQGELTQRGSGCEQALRCLQHAVEGEHADLAAYGQQLCGEESATTPRLPKRPVPPSSTCGPPLAPCQRTGGSPTRCT